MKQSEIWLIDLDPPRIIDPEPIIIHVQDTKLLAFIQFFAIKSKSIIRQPTTPHF